MNDALKAIANRRSIRQFKSEQISDADLSAILSAALQAPTGHNDQSCYFTAIRNKDLIKELSDGSKLEMQKSPVEWMAKVGKNEKLNIYYNAPTVIMVSAKKDAVTPMADVCASIQNILIAAESLGLGSCWIGFASFFFTGPERYSKIGIPEGYDVHYGVAIGYKPDNFIGQQPARKLTKYFHIIS